METICDSELDTNTSSSTSSSDLHDHTPGPIFPLVPPPIPNLAVPATGSEYTPSPTSSLLVPRFSAAAPAHLSNHNPPVPRFNAAHSSHHESRLSISQINLKSVSPNIPAQLSDALGKELTENTLFTTGKFLERLFPPERLPFPVNEELLRKLSTANGTNVPIWNDFRGCFQRPPMIEFGEAAVCQWLNTIGTTMGLVYGRQCERLWWSGRCTPLVSSSIQQKQDLVLLDRIYILSQKNFADTEWAVVKAVAEVHQSNAQPTETTRSYLTFLCQPHRRFTIKLSFFNPKKSKFSVTVIDRLGQIHLDQIDLMGSCVENGLLLLSILAFLMFGSPEDVGLDPHFKINPLNGNTVEVECGNRRFQLLKRIHALPKVVGRGTQVWIVVHNGIRYIMKDSWVREDNNEVAHLSRMLNHKELNGRVPTLICGGDVVINGFKDSMQRYRYASSSCSHRIHRRIVTSPIGESITSFKTKKEFIRVLINVIETHRYLHDHVGILHCDLSIENILINRKDNESEAMGLLIDYDYSVDTEAANHCAPDASDTRVAAGDTGHVTAPAFDDPKAPSSPTHRRGTPPFMSVEALLGINQTFVHKPQHDLESILYIILYICTFFHGPGLRWSNMSPPINTWSSDHIRDIGYLKLAHLECHEMAILPYFAPYWCDFAPFVKDLIVAGFPVRVRSPNEFQYDQFLQILKTAYDSVEEPHISRVPEIFGSGAQNITRIPKRENDSLDRDSKKGRLS